MTAAYPSEEHVVSRSGERTYRSSDGTEWRVDVRVPGASNVMLAFLHPRYSRLNRYAWHNWRGPEARSVTARIPKDRAVQSLSDEEIARLFRRSMPISAQRSG
jgi:hypothetical protein